MIQDMNTICPQCGSSQANLHVETSPNVYEVTCDACGYMLTQEYHPYEDMDRIALFSRLTKEFVAALSMSSEHPSHEKVRYETEVQKDRDGIVFTMRAAFPDSNKSDTDGGNHAPS